MHRPASLNFWLLLAATAAVDAVAIYWVGVTNLQHAGQLYFGLVCSQISVITIACFFSSRRRWAVIMPVAATLAVATLTASLREWKEGWQPILLYLSLWLPQIVVLSAILWMLTQTSYAARWTNRRPGTNWQFSVGHLLAIMTALSILLVILRFATDLRYIWLIIVLWVANNVLLAVVALIVWRTAWHALLRFAAVVGISLLLAFGIMAVSPNDPNSLAVNVVQAIVLCAWFGIGNIMPVRTAAGESGTST